MKLLPLSILLGYCTAQQQNMSSQEFIDKARSMSPDNRVTIVQTHLINSKHQLLLCKEAGKWNVPMGFRTNSEKNSEASAQKITLQNIGILSADWLQIGTSQATIDIPTSQGIRQDPINFQYYLTSQFLGKVAPDSSLYADCQWYSAQHIPSDNDLSNLSLPQQKLQDIVHITQAQQIRKK